MSFFNLGFGATFIISLAFVWHIIRTGRSPIWIAAVGFLGPIGWAAYILFAVLPDAANSRSARRFADTMVNAADPGRAYREKARQVQQVGSADTKRALAEESLKRGLFAEAVDLYASAMSGPLGESDSTLLKGMARAKLLSGDAAGAEDCFLKLKALDRNAFDADCELDYARALELAGKTDEAVRQYETVAHRYPGEEARTRFALLLEKLGQQDRAQALFREVVDSVRGAPGHYRSRQREWLSIARQHLT